MSPTSKASKPAAYDPATTMVIREVVPGVITTFSVPFGLFGGQVKAGGRGTLVRLRSGALAVFSPTALTPAAREVVAAQGGAVRYIVAPNLEHHLHVAAWADAYPDAAVVGVDGLPEKKKKKKKDKKRSAAGEEEEGGADVAFAHVFTASNKDGLRIGPDFDAEFAREFVDAARGRDLVFAHRPTGTLIEADLVFNLPATEQYSRTGEDATSGVLTMLAGRLFAAQGNSSSNIVWQKRNLWYGAGAADREGFAASMRCVREWHFDRIIPCHGDVIETGGKAVFEQVAEWFLEGKK